MIAQPSAATRAIDLRSITPFVITFNEEANITRVLERLAWASEVLVVDSFSTDATLELAGSFSNVRIVQREFDDFAGQCNFALGEIHTEWALSLDADYLCEPGLAAELSALPDDADVAGYDARFRYCIGGRPLRGNLYPPRTILHRRGRAAYRQDGHAHRVTVDGAVGHLRSRVDHDDRKPIGRWLGAQHRYAMDEVRKLTTTPRKELSRADRVRRLGWLAPLLMPAYCLIAKGLLLDGAAGLSYTLQRTYAELLLALLLADYRFTTGTL